MSGAHYQNSQENNRSSQGPGGREDRYFVSGYRLDKRTLVTLNPGQRLLNDRFTIKRLLGSGSVSRVYLADDTMRTEEVALKIVQIGPLGDSGLEAQIKKEAQLHTKITDYRHMVKVFDIHLAPYGGSQLLLHAMEYADGGTLRKWLIDHAGDV